MSKTRVVFVDDHNIVRAGLKSYLESFPDMQVVGVADSGEMLLDKISLWQPNVVVMDLLMPGGMDGIEATRRVRELAPKIQVVILTAYSDDARVIAGLRAGAISYVRKNSDMKVLLNAIRGAARRQSVLDPTVATALLQDFVQVQPEQDDSLTDREMDVLKLLASGKTNRQIGAVLSISSETVKSHVGNILSKFQLTQRAQVIVYALKNGILSLDEIEL